MSMYYPSRPFLHKAMEYDTELGWILQSDERIKLKRHREQIASNDPKTWIGWALIAFRKLPNNTVSDFRHSIKTKLMTKETCIKASALLEEIKTLEYELKSVDSDTAKIPREMINIGKHVKIEMLTPLRDEISKIIKDKISGLEEHLSKL